MKKTLAILFAALFVVSMFVGCSKPAVDAPKADAPKTDATDTQAAEEFDIAKAGDIELTLWSGYPEFDPWFAEMAAAYKEKYPNVTITSTTINLRDFETKLSTALPAGSGPDITTVDPSFFLRFINSGYAYPAPQYVSDFVNSASFDEPVQEFAKVDGVVYGVPTLISSAAIYYNKDMWAEAGLTDADAPKSLADIRTLAQKLAKFDDNGTLTRSGVALRLTGGGSGIGEKFWMWMMQEGHAIVKEVGDGKYVPDYNNEAGFNTLKMYIDIVWGDKTCNADIGTDAAGFEAGETAMFVREHWVMPEIAQVAPDLNYGAWPLWNAGMLQTNNWYVLTDDDVRSAIAWDYIMFILQPENQAKQAQIVGWFPGRNDVTIEGYDPDVLAAFSLAGKDVHQYPKLECNDELQTKFAEKLSTIGWASPEFYGNDELIHKFLDECEAESIAILKENGVYGG